MKDSIFKEDEILVKSLIFDYYLTVGNIPFFFNYLNLSFIELKKIICFMNTVE